MSDSDSDDLIPRITAAAALLEELLEDRGLLADVAEPLRKRLLMAAGRVAQPSARERRRLNRARRNKDKAAVRTADTELAAQAGIRRLRENPIFHTPRRQDPEAALPATLGTFARERVCYTCRAPYRELHFFYDQLCPSCGDLNFRKRSPVADLRGRVALVTGARVKIGYHAAILLLRSGCHVVVTTRFPRDAAKRYSAEPDFDAWQDRLQIVGIDLRRVGDVEAMCAQLLEQLDRLDFIINNACQTVRRPPGFYDHLMESELTLGSDLEEGLLLEAAVGSSQPAPPAERSLLTADSSRLNADGSELNADGSELNADGSELNADGSELNADGSELNADPSVASAAIYSALELLPGDQDRTAFPVGRLDADLQQVDTRSVNSWRLKMAEVPTVELLEVHLVNAVAPFLINARLKPLMERVASADKHIVNVSAMEGQFYRTFKSDKHPHTNMAKASLNMMTRTSAADFVDSGIHMNSVDTGWVTDEDPIHHAERKREEHGFHPPLDVVDGAARIVDPIFDGINTGEHVWGQFLKDYKPTDW
ncbi:MAG: SDR family oxidoreductase [Myxococcales bacterium]|nr:SDR family oxidoreductase [Myxococcales bacterium]